MNATSASIRIAIISDLHAAIPKSDGTSPSYLSTAPAIAIPQRDALLALDEMIERDSLTADYLVCCGDMADKAEPTAMTFVWDKFHSLAAKLKVKRAVATVGNHDIDSRYAYNDYDARGVLRGLKPSYPLCCRELDNEFWARNFVVVTEPDVRFVVLNSCAYHGVNPRGDAPEYAHGRVSRRTLDDLRVELQRNQQETRPINLLVCHHHPHKHLDIEDDEYSSMAGGEQLIDLLSSSGLGSWIVVHGHKHQPRLCWGAGGASPPLIFGAGSFSAKLAADIVANARNQLYVITVLADEAQRLRLDLAGEVTSWEYTITRGWQTARTGSGLPARCGFGFRPSLRNLAQTLLARLPASDSIVKWNDVVLDQPELRLLLPMDIESLRIELDRLGVRSTADEYGVLFELVRTR